MVLNNYVVKINKINSTCNANNLSFKGKKSESSNEKNYYTYETTRSPFLIIEGITIDGIIGISAGLSILFSYGFSKLMTKMLKKALPKWSYVLPGIALAFATVGASLSILSNKRIKHLKPISKEEQTEKEQKIKKIVEDLAKQKDVKINGIYFYDFIRTKGDTFALAGFDPSIGCLIINSKFKDTDLDIDEVIPLILHELVHAKQYETIARAEDGLYDLNRITIITETKKLKDDEKKELLNANDEDLTAIAQKRIHNLKDFILLNEEIDLKDEINLLKGIKIYLNNPDVSKYDLPMALNENYYKNAIKEKGPLTPEETEKVKSYLEYMEKSISVKVKKGEIGKSEETTENYYNDPMEIEAYKVQNEYVKTGKIT